MTYGWKVLDSAGHQIFGTKRLLRFAYYAKITANGSATVANLVAASSVGIVLPSPFSSAALQVSPLATLTVTDGNVAWSRSTWTDASWGAFAYFIYVLQWK